MHQPSFFTIKEPCHENWENMTVSDKGKYCSSCNKDVYDFTNATLAEVKTAYEENNKNMCGRISLSLLKEQYVYEELKQRNTNYLKRFCLSIIICFGTTLFLMSSAKANSLTRLKNKFLYTESDTVKKDSIIIKGVLKDKDTKEEIPFANVVLFKNGVQIAGTITDMDGNFSFKMHKNSNDLDLKATFVGYYPKEIKKLKIVEQDFFITVELEEDTNAIGNEIMGMIIYQVPLLDPFQSGKTIIREDYINGAPK